MTDGHNSTQVRKSFGEAVRSLPPSRSGADSATWAATSSAVKVEDDLMGIPPQPLAPSRPRAWGTRSPPRLCCLAAPRQEPRPALMRSQWRTPTLDVLLPIPGPSYRDIPSAWRKTPGVAESMRYPEKMQLVYDSRDRESLKCPKKMQLASDPRGRESMRYPKEMQLVSDTRDRLGRCAPAERSCGSELLVSDEEESPLARLSAFQEYAVPVDQYPYTGGRASCYPVKKRCQLCSCSDLDYVALVAVIPFEQNNTVSSSFYFNSYQFLSCTDPDKMTTFRIVMVEESHQNWENPSVSSGLPPPEDSPSSPERTAPYPEAPRKDDRASLASVTIPVSDNTGTCQRSIEDPDPASSSGRSRGLVLTSLAGQSSQPPIPSLRSLRSSDSLPAMLLRHLLLGLFIAPSSTAANRLTLGSLVGILHPVVMADCFALRNGYGTVKARYHLTAYDCSDPTEVQAYSSIPASHCSVRATPVQKDRPTRFQLLQKEKKRYITAYSCFLFRTDIRYNCGVYGHPELDPMHWSFAVPQRVTVEQCMTWL